ncbi:MAG TPA: diacylglycerol kinase family protein [Pyrinomonadaceae bacterium]|jgi:YegS/Rv2252/BmrU family lipid kinase|nr:diacylglycerol kinase family protein [Pyrinomonadaceae bacterium]
MSEQAETFVVVNYNAARARAAWKQIERALKASGVRFSAHEAKEAGDAQRAAREALGAGYRTIAVVGGDGTLGEVVSGFFARETEGVSTTNAATTAATTPARINAEAALAILPAGTGNDFARGLEGGRASLERWLERLIRHSRREHETEMTTRAVDVLHGTIGDDRARRSFFCLNAATLGIGAEVAGRVAAQGSSARRLPGEARFALAALASLARWRARRVSVRLDDAEAIECATNLVAVVNSPFAGGGMMFSPDARVDDGLLDVVIASQLTRAALMREMARIHSGGHVKNPRVSISRGARVRIEHLSDGDALAIEADGDVRGHTPLEFRVLPGALKVVK